MFRQCTKCSQGTFFGTLYILTDDINLCQDCYSDLPKCSDCEEGFLADDLFAVEDGNKHVCDDCMESYFVCHGCNDMTHEDVGHTAGEEAYCESCYDDIPSCESCRDLLPNEDDQYTYNGDVYCEECYYETFSHCDSCYETFYQDDLRYSERHCEAQCESCYSDDQVDQRDVNVDSTDFLCDTPGQIVKSSRTIGVEIETEPDSGADAEVLSHRLDSDVGLKEDGSLSNEGVEIVTPPAQGKLFEELMDETCTVIDDAGYGVDSSCGLHVHVGAAELVDDESLQEALYLVAYAAEPVMMAMQPSSRRNSNYCQPISDHAVNKPVKDALVQAKVTRYHTVNFQALRAHGTIEFRGHTGTTEASKIKHWAAICAAIIDLAVSDDVQSFLFAMLTAQSIGDKVDVMVDAMKLTDETKEHMKQRIAKFM